MRIQPRPPSADRVPVPPSIVLQPVTNSIPGTFKLMQSAQSRAAGEAQLPRKTTPILLVENVLETRRNWPRETFSQLQKTCKKLLTLASTGYTFMSAIQKRQIAQCDRSRSSVFPASFGALAHPLMQPCIFDHARNGNEGHHVSQGRICITDTAYGLFHDVRLCVKILNWTRVSCVYIPGGRNQGQDLIGIPSSRTAGAVRAPIGQANQQGEMYHAF
jgi:hypothetical protein